MFKYLPTILKYACPLLVAVLPCLIAIGILSPWSVAQTALGPSATRDALLIGWSYNYRASGAITHERREQTYAVLPTLKTITVIQEDGNVRIEEKSNGLLAALVGYACVLFGVWWFWFRKTPTKTTK
ncbi:hypothetical protein PEP31012_00838 [Pandoraea eparura]|uniref:Uncharacterized protein n=1 Tax=Pandoraea eparura TaxID=2508291 RepID=A0A5E4SM16_9BURK|nr:hypothetical protein [Pandoraea eparura]VVD75932.1 hypothetical protein PEP31012_00838 [Pandoraea eparura]